MNIVSYDPASRLTWLQSPPFPPIISRATEDATTADVAVRPLQLQWNPETIVAMQRFFSYHTRPQRGASRQGGARPTPSPDKHARPSIGEEGQAGAALAPRLGAAAFISAVVAGQLICSLALDHFGLMNVPQQPLTAARLLGAALVFAGVLLVKYV